MTTTIEERVSRLERLAGMRRKHDHSVPTPRTQREVEIIQREVAREFGLTTEAMLARTRRPEICWPRQVAMHLAYQIIMSGSKVIGVGFGRDNYTVLHASRAVRAAMDTEQGVRLMVERLTQEIRIKIANEHAK